MERRKAFDLVFKDDANVDQKWNEQEQCIECLPLVKLTIDAYVNGEDEIVVGDILTVKIKVEFVNLKEGEQPGYVHSKTYPFLRRDTWYLIITDSSFTGIAACEKLPINEKVFEKTLTERMARPGPIAF